MTHIGAFLKHATGVLILCWRRMLRAGAVAFAVGLVLGELVAVIVTGQALPGPLAQIAALLFGVALGYAVAMTVLLEEFVLGAVELVRMLEGDMRAGERIATSVAEREIGDLATGLRHLIGLPVASRVAAFAASHSFTAAQTGASARRSVGPSGMPMAGDRVASRMPTTVQQPVAPILPPLPRSTGGQTGASVTSRAATPTTPGTPGSTYRTLRAAMGGLAIEGISAAARGAMASQRPASSPQMAPGASNTDDSNTPGDTASGTAGATPPGEPVRADRLPRIEWTYEHPAINLAPAAQVARPETLAPTTPVDASAEAPLDAHVVERDPAATAPIVAADAATVETASTGAGAGPDTLAELADVAVVEPGGPMGGANDDALSQSEQIGAGPADTPRDSATGAHGATSEQMAEALVAPNAALVEDSAPESSQDGRHPFATAALAAAAPAALVSLTDQEDAPALEDAPLAPPTSFALDEPVTTAAADEAETASADEAASHVPEVTVAEPAQTAWSIETPPAASPTLPLAAPATTPMAVEDGAPESGQQVDEQLTQVGAALTPEAAYGEPLNTAPTQPEVESPSERAAEPSAPETTAATPDAAETFAGVAAPVAPVPESAEEAESDTPEAAEFIAQPEAAEPEGQSALAAQAESTAQPQEEPEPPIRSPFGRDTRPIGVLGATFEAAGRGGVPSIPRSSAPESGLWERLSEALLNRAGAPTGPFATPLSEAVSGEDDVTAPTDQSEAESGDGATGNQ